MSAELKARLDKVAEEDFREEEKQLEANLPRIKNLLLKISEVKKLEVIVWMEGTRQTDLNRDEKDLSFLERANLIKGKMKYTHRNVYREYVLTSKGAELTERLSAER